MWFVWIKGFGRWRNKRRIQHTGVHEKSGGSGCRNWPYRWVQDRENGIHQNRWILRWETWGMEKDPISYGRARTNLVQAAIRPMVEVYLGLDLCDELFKRYENRVSTTREFLHITCFFGVVAFSAIRIWWFMFIYEMCLFVFIYGLSLALIYECVLRLLAREWTMEIWGYVYMEHAGLEVIN